MVRSRIIPSMRCRFAGATAGLTARVASMREVSSIDTSCTQLNGRPRGSSSSTRLPLIAGHILCKNSSRLGGNISAWRDRKSQLVQLLAGVTTVVSQLDSLPTDSGSILLPCSGSVLVRGVDPDFLIAPLPPR
jgi:hypothetical protein